MPNCCVVGCNNNLKNSNVTLHNFPRRDKEPQRYKAWKNRINRQNFIPNNNHVVCSVHFEEKDFVGRYKKQLLPNEKTVRKLRKTAVPSLHLGGNKGAASTSNTIRRSSTYIRKKIVDEMVNQNRVNDTEPGSAEKSMDVLETEADVIQYPEKENAGVQCELGTEIYARYSDAFEQTNISDDDFVCSSDLEDSEMSESDNDDMFTEIPDNNNYIDDEIQEDDIEVQFHSLLSNDPSTSSQIVLVHINCLVSLFNFCETCGSKIKEKRAFTRGAVFFVKYTCFEGHRNKWSSWDNPHKCTLHLSSVLLLSGISFSPFANFAKTLKLLFLSHVSYYKTIKKNISPLINQFWVKHRNENYAAAKAEEDLWISGDGQYDSPGFSAKYITYSIMNVKTKKILDFVLLQRGMVEGELERAACQKALIQITSTLPVKLFLSDRHRGVGVLLRQSYPSIIHEFDVWHLAKSLVKKLSKVEKKSRLLSQWTRAITNHLWWSSETCGGNSEILVEKFTSLLKHVCNIHEWKDEDGNTKTCGHETYNKKDLEEIKWIRFGSSDYQALHNEIMNKTFLKDVKHTSHYCHTSALESYHNVRLKYVPKRVHFSYGGMYIRSILAVLDHNFNVDREVSGGNVKYSKATKRWNYKNSYAQKDDTWKTTLVQMILDHDFEAEVVQPLHFQVPKNISKAEKPSLEEAKNKHYSRFK